jgi:hypothetical protein
VQLTSDAEGERDRAGMAGEGVIFISQVPTAGDSGPVAQWILTASWAAAARAVWGKSWILTPEGVFAPEEALRHASRQTLQSRPARWWRPMPQKSR